LPETRILLLIFFIQIIVSAYGIRPRILAAVLVKIARVMAMVPVPVSVLYWYPYLSMRKVHQKGLSDETALPLSENPIFKFLGFEL